MSTLSVHPIEYLREHVTDAHIMKKLLKLILLIGFTLFLIGGFYNTLANINTTARDVVMQTYTNAFPMKIPDIAIDPFVYAPLP